VQQVRVVEGEGAGRWVRKCPDVEAEFGGEKGKELECSGWGDE
jgi:hypothetical protein